MSEELDYELEPDEEILDAVVVGAGIMGAATARVLARAGRSVLLLERFELGHPGGSSHGAARIFRLSYDDPAYVRMAQAARKLWREAEDDVGEPLLVTTGGLDVGEAVPRNRAALEACGVPSELIDAAEAARRFPFLSLPGADPVLYQEDAGVIRAAAALQGFVRSASWHGASYVENMPVLGLREGPHGVTAATPAGPMPARVAVVTAGAWSRELLAGVGIDLPVVATRETVSYYRLPDGIRPPSIVDWAEPPPYALWGTDGLLKVGLHHTGPETDPDHPGLVDPAIVERQRAWVASHVPAADPSPVRAETCVYTNTEDESFVLERHGPIVVGSACSGHAFKFAPLIGERLADLATRG